MATVSFKIDITTFDHLREIIHRDVLHTQDLQVKADEYDDEVLRKELARRDFQQDQVQRILGLK